MASEKTEKLFMNCRQIYISDKKIIGFLSNRTKQQYSETVSRSYNR